MGRWRAALRLTGVGFFVGTCIVLGIVGGFWLDNKLNTNHVFLLIGIVLGIVIAGFGVYQMLQPFLNNKRDKEDN